MINDKSDRSLGNAKVVFSNKFSAKRAIEKYNNVLLYGMCVLCFLSIFPFIYKI